MFLSVLSFIKLLRHIWVGVASGWGAERSLQHRLVGLVVKASASRAEDPGFESHVRWDFSGRVVPVT